MKLSEAIEKYGDCEVKAELIDLIDTKPKTIYDWDSFSVRYISSCVWKNQGAIYLKDGKYCNKAIGEVGKDRLAKYLKEN